MMNPMTVTVQEAYQDEMALDDDPVLTFRSSPASDHDCIVIDLFAEKAPGSFGARCCICGQTTQLAGSALLTTTPNLAFPKAVTP